MAVGSVGLLPVVLVLFDRGSRWGSEIEWSE